MALDIKNALDIRKRIKSKKPTFIRQDAHKKAKLKVCWRKPRGLHSKMRMKKRSYRRLPAIGFGSPRMARDLNRIGLKEIVVNNVADLLHIKESKKDLSLYCIVVASSVGTRKKVSIIKKALELGFAIDNVRNPETYEAKVKQMLDTRQKAAKARKSEQDKKTKAVDDKKSKKKEKSIDQTVADKKDAKPIKKADAPKKEVKAEKEEKPKSN